MENPLTSEILSRDCSTIDPCEEVQNILQGLPDPVKFLSPVIEIFVPIGKEETLTMLGLWFDTVGFLHVYVHQALLPDNLFTQIKVVTLRLPIAWGFTIFNLGLAMFFSRSFIMALRAATAETSDQIQRSLQKTIDKLKKSN